MILRTDATRTGVALMTLVVALSARADIAKDTIRAIWLFDEENAATAEDASGNGNTGELVGVPAWEAGQFGMALSLDGAESHVLVPDSPDLDAALSDGFTIVVWVRGEYVNDWHGVLTKAEDWDNTMSYLIQRDRDSAAFNAGLFPTGDAAGATWFASTVVPEDDVWYHLAVRYDGAEASYLVDGEVKTVIAYAVGVQDNGSPLVIGSNYPNAIQGFPGLIDDVGIFSAALDDDDIGVIIEVGLANATGIAPVEPAGKLPLAWGALRRASLRE